MNSIQANNQTDLITLHGVFVKVFGIGVFITGESGVGKSEIALELISRGHSLIADDSPHFSRANEKTILGSSPELLQDFIEIRGLGILNIRALFGDQAISFAHPLNLIIRIVSPGDDSLSNIDRLCGMHAEQNILGINIPEITLPIAIGCSLASLVETASRNHMLKLQGYDSAKIFLNRC